MTPGQPGVSGKAFLFSGKPSYVSVPSATDLNPVTSTFTITLHVKFPARPTSAVGDFDVLRKGLSSTNSSSYKIEILQSGKAFCDFRGATHEGSLTGTKALAVERVAHDRLHPHAHLDQLRRRRRDHVEDRDHRDHQQHREPLHRREERQRRRPLTGLVDAVTIKKG